MASFREKLFLSFIEYPRVNDCHGFRCSITPFWSSGVLMCFNLNLDRISLENCCNAISLECLWFDYSILRARSSFKDSGGNGVCSGCSVNLGGTLKPAVLNLVWPLRADMIPTVPHLCSGRGSGFCNLPNSFEFHSWSISVQDTWWNSEIASSEMGDVLKFHLVQRKFTAYKPTTQVFTSVWETLLCILPQRSTKASPLDSAHK